MNRHFDFDAAIFDLDGTLIDSMYVWGQVDRTFFARHNREVTEEYVRHIAGLSFIDTAKFTKAYLNLIETPEEISAIWMELAREEYVHRVPLKPGAKEYLEMLRRSGVRMAVATANAAELFEPCLKRLGVYDCFDAFCTTDETGERDKSTGAVFRLAADRLGVKYDRCVVYEDLIEGIAGAKNAGMGAVCMLDDANSHAHARIAKIADRMAASFFELTAEVPCTIFTARCEGDVHKAYLPAPREFVLCADAGWRLAEAAGAQIDAVIGDFDSGEAPAIGTVIRHPVMKDDTDALLCVRYAMEMGVRDIRVVGGLGGRMDHTLSNLQILRHIARHGGRATLSDGNVRMYTLQNGEITLPRTAGKLSVFALTDTCTGINIRGAKYELIDGTITSDFPIGMGNDFAADAVTVSVGSGILLIVCDSAKEDGM